MTKLDLAVLLAQESGRSAAEAADDLDELVQKILKNRRRSRPAPAPKSHSSAAKGPEDKPVKTAKAAKPSRS